MRCWLTRPEHLHVFGHRTWGATRKDKKGGGLTVRAENKMGRHGTLNESKCARGAHLVNREKSKQQAHQVLWQQGRGQPDPMLRQTIGKDGGESVDGCHGQEGRLRAHAGDLHEDDMGRRWFKLVREPGALYDGQCVGELARNKKKKVREHTTDCAML